MKIRTWMLHLGLILTVVVSIAFTWLIWFNPTTFFQNVGPSLKVPPISSIPI